MYKFYDANGNGMDVHIYNRRNFILQPTPLIFFFIFKLTFYMYKPETFINKFDALI